MFAGQTHTALRPFLQIKTRTRIFALNFAIAMVYLAAAKLGLTYAVVQANVTAIWPPAGIAIGAALLWGPTVAPGIFLGALAANLSTGGLPAVAALAIASGNTLEAIVTYFVARRSGMGAPPWDQSRHIWILVAIVAFISTPLSASIGILALSFAGLLVEGSAQTAFETWWLGDFSGAVLFAPLVIAWAQQPNKWQPSYRMRRIFEVVGLALATLIVGRLVFSDAAGAERAPFAFFVLPVIVWAVFRFGRRGAMLVIVALATLAVDGTVHRLGPFATENFEESLLLLQSFVGVLAVTTLLMGALLRERSNAEMALQNEQLRLEERVNDRTQQLRNVAEGLAESEGRWRAITESSPDYILIVGPSYSVQFANRRLPLASQLPPIGSSLFALLPDPFAAEVRQSIEHVFQSGQANSLSLEYTTVDGKPLLLDARFTPIMRGHTVVAVSLHLHDVTEPILSSREGERLAKQVRLLLESTGEGIFGVGPDLRCTFANHSACQILGWSVDALLGKDMHEVLLARREGGVAYAREQSPMRRALTQKQSVISEGDMFQTQAGELIPVQYSANPILENGEPVGVAVVFRNVAEGRAMARKLDFLATHDPLTGLINRREFEQRVQRALTLTQKNGVRHVLAYLDLDQVKVVNANCGHAGGDELLRQLTVLLSGEVKPGDALARLDGDEFGVLMCHRLVEDAMPALEGLCKVVREFRFVWEDKTFALGVSIGVTQIDTLTQNMGNALGEADAACYLAKDRGRNRIHVYQTDDAELSKRHGEMQWVVRVQEALTKERFFLACQIIRPIKDSPHLFGGGPHYEILLRMRDEQGFTVPPGAFIPAAERYNLMAGIDRWVISNVFNWLESHRLAMGHVESWTINLSGQSFNDEGLLSFIRDGLISRNIPPASICFEITETAAVANLKGAAHFIATLKQLGCRFALDDFGSGMSSFAYLKNLPVDYLKIDGNFVRDIAVDEVDYAMVTAINRVGQVMGIRTVAEFVENDLILQKLREIGVDYAQGYGIGKPMPLSELSSIA